MTTMKKKMIILGPSKYREFEGSLISRKLIPKNGCSKEMKKMAKDYAVEDISLKNKNGSSFDIPKCEKFWNGVIETVQGNPDDYEVIDFEITKLLDLDRKKAIDRFLMFIGEHYEDMIAPFGISPVDIFTEKSLSDIFRLFNFFLFKDAGGLESDVAIKEIKIILDEFKKVGILSDEYVSWNYQRLVKTLSHLEKSFFRGTQKEYDEDERKPFEASDFPNFRFRNSRKKINNNDKKELKSRKRKRKDEINEKPLKKRKKNENKNKNSPVPQEVINTNANITSNQIPNNNNNNKRISPKMINNIPPPELIRNNNNNRARIIRGKKAKNNLISAPPNFFDESSSEQKGK